MSITIGQKRKDTEGSRKRNEGLAKREACEWDENGALAGKPAASGKAKRKAQAKGGDQQARQAGCLLV